MRVSRASARAVEDALRAGISVEAAKAAGAAADVASNLGMDDAWCASEAEAAAKAAQHAITKGICSAEAAEIASEVTARARATAKQLGRNSAAAAQEGAAAARAAKDALDAGLSPEAAKAAGEAAALKVAQVRAPDDDGTLPASATKAEGPRFRAGKVGGAELESSAAAGDASGAMPEAASKAAPAVSTPRRLDAQLKSLGAARRTAAESVAASTPVEAVAGGGAGAGAGGGAPGEENKAAQAVSTPRRLDAQLKNLGATRKTVAQPFPAGAPLEVAANGVAAGSTARDAVQLDLADVDTQAFQCPRCSRVLGMDAKRCSKCGTTTDGVDKMESAARLSAAKAEVASAAEQKALEAGLSPEAAKAAVEAAKDAIHKGKAPEEAVAAAAGKAKVVHASVTRELGSPEAQEQRLFQCPRCSRALGMNAKRCSKCGSTTYGVDKAESAARLSAAKAEVVASAERKALDAGLHPEAAKAAVDAAKDAIHKGKTPEAAVTAAVEMAQAAHDSLTRELGSPEEQLFQCPRCSRALNVGAKRCSKCGTTTDGVDKAESAARLSAAKAEVASAVEQKALEAGLSPEAAKAAVEAAKDAIHKGKAPEEAVAAAAGKAKVVHDLGEEASTLQSMKKKASDLYSSAKEAASSKLGGFKAAVNELAEGDTPVVQGEAFRCPRCSRALGMDAKRCSKCGTTTDGVDKAESAAVLSAAKAEAASAAEQKALDAGRSSCTGRS
ncbi:hypothetical protein EMIHUDRAFT_198779 [Emiliania huxleyi CCMP1516]|uniref:RanBP2-type domain-containing protein n=2 Tax=Emiliania huxleyi TaxID=2903 RepID=A0A0D3I7V2_EMIH1|nr:hypothetical protein EMIHUDRAFT_198779 [Emiliania huxleyi CCMP1516]EOD07337.1 hypothetical protein EMIHUDRAFT_198779 [Emiliania huxleyi CCMP1516]|eukprot:XP_005759766.1 hypothetical protein EMIHUDRAFT_198779 [Emiliania huxleyi CCMP1516]